MDPLKFLKLRNKLLESDVVETPLDFLKMRNKSSARGRS